ncbi:MAG: MBL fold metallo-hydrolase [Armatimonadetes bacterium]|nr:MBL fold metallo-hydrolase [Armatimonadota bacterium]
MELLPNIHQIRCPYANRNVFVYLLTGERTMLIDTALSDSPEGSILPYMADINLPPDNLDYILISHPDTDHQGGNDPLREKCSKALFMAHTLDAPLIEATDVLLDRRQDYSDYGIPMTPKARDRVRSLCHATTSMDVTLQGGERFRLSEGWTVEVLHTPGHSLGHLIVYDRKHRVALIQDAALGSMVPEVEGKAELPPTYRYIDTYLQTLHQLSSLPIDTLLTAHFPVMRGAEVQNFLSLSRAYCLNAERLVCEAVLDSSEAPGLPELITQLSDSLGDWPKRRRPMLAWSFLGHLERLEAHQAVRRIEGDPYVRWTKR